MCRPTRPTGPRIRSAAPTTKANIRSWEQGPQDVVHTHATIRRSVARIYIYTRQWLSNKIKPESCPATWGMKTAWEGAAVALRGRRRGRHCRHANRSSPDVLLHALFAAGRTTTCVAAPEYQPRGAQTCVNRPLLSPGRMRRHPVPSPFDNENGLGAFSAGLKIGLDCSERLRGCVGLGKGTKRSECLMNLCIPSLIFVGNKCSHKNKNNPLSLSPSALANLKMLPFRLLLPRTIFSFSMQAITIFQ